MRTPRRLFKATRSRSCERSELDAGSTRGQLRGKVVLFRTKLDNSRAVPRSNQRDEVGSSGTGVHGGIRVPNVAFVAAPSIVLVPGVPPLARLAPRYGRHGSVTVRAWVVSPWATGYVFNITLCLSVPGRTARAPAVAAARTDPAPPRAAASARGRPTGPARCRRHHSENSERRSCPDARRTNGLWPSVNRAMGSHHGVARPGASAPGSRAVPKRPPGGAALGRCDNR